MTFVIQFIMWFFVALFWWKIFVKANIKGWKALIPFYCDYVKFDMADKKWLYIPYLILSVIESVVSFIYTALQLIELADTVIEQVNVDSDLTGMFWLRIVLSVLVFGISVMVGIRIADKFGKSKMFGVGLGVLPIVFAPILAFDNSIYRENTRI